MRALALLLCLAALARAAEIPEEETEAPAPRPAKPFSPPRLKATPSRFDAFRAGSATTTARFEIAAPKPAPGPKTEKTKVPTAAEIGAQIKDEVKVPLTPFEWPGKPRVEEAPAKAKELKAEVTITIPEARIDPPRRQRPALLGFHALNVVPVGSVDASGKPRVPYCGKGLGVAPGVSPKACCELGQFVCGRRGCAASCERCRESLDDAECVPVSEPDPNYFDDANFFRGGSP